MKLEKALHDYLILNRKRVGKIYKRSISIHKNSLFALIKDKNIKRLLIISKSKNIVNLFSGIPENRIGGFYLKRCFLNISNAEKLARIVPYLNPVQIKSRFSIGLGDRIGVTTPAHIRAINKRHGIFPLFAQQSVRELEKTGRTPDMVLSDVRWAVFQEGYRKGFGADGDHLKFKKDILKFINAGFSMFTIDLSEHLRDCRNTNIRLIEKELCHFLPENTRNRLLENYLDRTFNIRGMNIYYDKECLFRIIYATWNAIIFASKIYEYIKYRKKHFDFEVSIDELNFPTSSEMHFFIVNELKKLKVKITGFAPRFVGEFEKGIDYIGDIKKFKTDFKNHIKLAVSFRDYRVSVHSGSDKFKLYGIIKNISHCRYHLKTSGTSWLETLKFIGQKDKILFKDIYSLSLKYFNSSKKFYKIRTEKENIPDIAKFKGKHAQMFNNSSVRQLLHISYGIFLRDFPEYEEKISKIINEREDEYYNFVAEYISKHL